MALMANTHMHMSTQLQLATSARLTLPRTHLISTVVHACVPALACSVQVAVATSYVHTEPPVSTATSVVPSPDTATSAQAPDVGGLLAPACSTQLWPPSKLSHTLPPFCAATSTEPFLLETTADQPVLPGGDAVLLQLAPELVDTPTRPLLSVARICEPSPLTVTEDHAAVVGRPVDCSLQVCPPSVETHTPELPLPASATATSTLPLLLEADATQELLPGEPAPRSGCHVTPPSTL